MTMPLVEFEDGHFVNEFGNVVRRFATLGISDRYHFDFHVYLPVDGWQQYDTNQDAAYFGIWVNIEKRQIATYAEGDFILVKAPDDESLKAELEAMEKTYGPAPPAFRVIHQNGTRTHIYAKRPDLDVE